MLSQIIIRTVNLVIEALETKGIDYAIFGGLALQAWKRIRSTLDVDIMVIINKEEIEPLIETILEKGLRRDVESPEVKLGEITLFRFIYLDEESLLDIKVDIAIARGGFPKKVVRNRVKLNVLGRDMWFVGCEDLILLKVLSNRPIDIADARELMSINKEVIDKDYLYKQASELKIETQLREMEKSG